MEQSFSGSGPTVREHDQTALVFNEEIQRIIAPAQENASSFTALLELPPTQAMELLHHSPNYDGAAAAAETLSDNNDRKPLIFDSFNRNLTFPSNTAMIECSSKFSVFAEENSPPEDVRLAPLHSGANLNIVKNELPETDSNPCSTMGSVADAAIDSINERAGKRKERENKVKGSSKKSKIIADDTTGDGEKLPYVHVRARRGEATDSHSLAERARREKINARMKLLQDLVPGCNKISGTALVLDEIINHVQSLQRQVEFLSMKLAAVNPRIDFNLDSILATEEGASLMGSNFPSMVTPLMWPEVPVNGNREQYQQQWQFDAFNQTIWGREENHNFMTPENSLLSYDSSANSASLHSNHLRMEL